MFIDRNILAVKTLEILKNTIEIPIQNLAGYTGVSIDELNSVLKELAKYYFIEFSNNRVSWSRADNPSLIKPWGWNIVHEIILGSTQEYIRGCSLWTVVVAELQIYGRGRHGKKWYSNLGGLWCSFRLTIRSDNINYLPLAVPLIIVNILNRYYGINALIKWPNDIIYGNKKLAGLIIEAEALHNMFIANIGIGFNVNNNPPIPGSISLRNIVGYKIPRNGLLSQLIGWIGRLEKLLIEPRKLVDEYLAKLSTLNRMVQVKTSSGTIIGRAVNVNEYGELVMRVNGEEKIFTADEVIELRHID